MTSRSIVPVLALLTMLGTSSVQAQNWTEITAPPPGVRITSCLLMTDGSVICQAGPDWYKLKPDMSGSYVNGTWSQIASFPAGYEPYTYASAVLADGRAVVIGGEYSSSGQIVLSNGAAIYNPVTNTWTSLAAPAGWLYIGDAPATVLADGRFLIGSKLDTRMAVLDPATLNWTAINPIGKLDFFNSEENWMLLPDGTVFTVDVKTSFGSERFFPSTSAWVSSGSTPVEMRSPPGEGAITIAPGVIYGPPGDMGPHLLMPDGKVFVVGGTGHTAIYTPPPPLSTATGSWVPGPEIPGSLWVNDGPGAVLPNGHVLIAASPQGDRHGLAFFEFDGTNFISVPPNPNASSDASNFTSLLLLPTGQVLLIDGSSSVQIYSPTGTYNPSWAPAVSSVPTTLSNGTTYQIDGTQFNGLSQGSAFGDELQDATNYPLVRITNNASGHVFYARTHDHSSMGVATGSTPVSTYFDVPANTELGDSALVVVANGIPSVGVPVTIASPTPPPVNLTCPAATGIIGIPYNSALVASGGKPPFTYTLLSGSLPSSLGLTGGTGAIIGTPSAAGVFNFRTQATDTLAGVQAVDCTITTTPPPAVGFQLRDAVTQGNWKGVYGSQGYIIANDSNQPPAYGTVSVTGSSPPYTWVASTTDPRALLKGASTTDRIASTYYSGTNFTFDVNLTGGQHQVALYLLDFDSTSRTQNISFIDANTNAVLDTRSFSNFHGGVYAVWNMQGHVLIKVSWSGGQNAVVSGLFFGPPAGGTVPAAPVVSITAPSAGDVSGTVSVTANATAAAGMASVQFQLDGANLGSLVPGGGPPFSTSWITTGTSNGLHSLTAIAADTLGQTTTSSSVTVNVANGGPSYVLTTAVSPAGSGSIAASPSSAGGSYSAGTSVQLTATPAANCAFSTWTGLANSTLNPQSVTMSAAQSVTANFNCTAPPPGFLTGFALGSPPLRNDFAGLVGFKFTVGANPLAITALGRICVAGNGAAHTLKLVKVSDGSDVPGASVPVSMAGCTAGQFMYVPVSSIALPAATSFYLVSQEAAGGDRWYDQGSISATNVATVNSSVYFYNGSWFPIGAGNTSYVPPNFQYTVVTPVPISVTVQTNPGGFSFSVDGASVTTPQNLTWTAGSSHTIATTSPQGAGAGTQNVWAGWSDGGAISHSVAPPSGIAYTATFTTQYLLTSTVSPAGGGSIGASPSSASGYYDTGTPVQLTATPASGCTFQNWTGGGPNPQSLTMSAPQSVTANFQCTAPPTTNFLTGFALNNPPLRNDFSGIVGMKFTVGATPLAITALGRICVVSNTLTHTVKLVNVGTGIDVPNGSASVSMGGCTPGQFVYAAVGSITLPAATSFYLVSQEAAGGDRWYDQGSISSTSVATVNSSVYFYNGSWFPIGAGNTSYAPPNFQYAVVTPVPISVTVQTNPGGFSFSVDGASVTTPQNLTWTAGSSHTIATTSPQGAGAGTQNVWTGWNDAGAISHSVAPLSGIAYTASFTTQYLLTSTVSPAGGGSIGTSPSSASGYYDTGTPVQLTAAPASGCTFQNWTGGGPNPQSLTMSAPQSVTANFQCAAPATTNFLTGFALNNPPLRNDFSGFVGMRFTVGATPLAITTLGRICVAGNGAGHTVKLVNAGTGIDVPNGSAAVNMAGCTPGQFVYAGVSSITLQANTTYYLASQEVQGGDRWYDQGWISTTTAAAVKNSVYFYGGNWIPINSLNTSYVPVNFQYAP